MAQAYEYVVSESTDSSTFATNLATLDGEGWEVVGFGPTTSPGGILSVWALLRRRLDS